MYARRCCNVNLAINLWTLNLFSDLRFQLQEQLKSLDGRVETQVALTSELQDFFRRRAEVELEYSRSLDKLAKTLAFRQKELKTKYVFRNERRGVLMVMMV